MNKALSPIKKHSFQLSANASTLLMCFGLPFIGMVLIYYFLRVWPAGENSVLVLDLNAQYIYYFEQLRDILTTGESIIYSFERALGGEFMGIFAYYLSSPFSLIVALFPKENITEALYFILILKTGFCGLTFGYYLTKTRNIQPIYRVIFSTLYALCSYVVVMQHNVMWIDNVIAFPLILLAVDELIKHGKFKMYVLALVYSVFSSFYIGYMTCLFILIWFFVRYFMLSPTERNPHGESKHFIKALTRIAIWSILAVLICAIIIFPTYYSLTFGKLEFSDPKYEPEQLFEFADLLTKTFFGSYDTVRPSGMPFIYCGTFALVLAPLYFFADDIPTRKKVGMAVMMLILIISFNFSIADIVWHGMQRPNWLNARFAYMFVGLELIMAADAFVNLPKIGRKTVTCSAVLWCALLVILSKIGYDHLHDFMSVWPGILCFILIASILPSCIRSMKDPNSCRMAATALLFVIFLEAVGNGVVMLYSLDDDVAYSKRSSYRQMVDTYTPAVETFLDKDSDDFYRAEKLVHRKKNDNFALDLNGMTNSTSTLNARAIALLQQFGYASQSHWSMYAGATAVTDALFGIKYVIADETDNKDVMEYIHDLYDLYASTDKHLDVYENPYSLSIAYSVNEKTLKYDLPAPIPEDEEKPQEKDYVDPFTYMNELLSAMTGEKIKVWKRVDVAESSEQGVKEIHVTGHRSYEQNDTATAKLSWTLDVESSDKIYVYFPSKYPRKAELNVNGKDIGDYFDGEDFSIREIGSFEEGEKVKVSLYLDEEKIYIRSGCSFFWYFDESAFLEAIAMLKDGTMDAHSDSDDHIWGTINVPSGDSVVFTTIPYDAGWKVTVDGIEVETVPVLNDTLLAFNITEGEHELEFKYEPDCIKYGLLISGAGLLIFAAAWVIDSVISKKKKQAVADISEIKDSHNEDEEIDIPDQIVADDNTKHIDDEVITDD